MTEAEQAVYRIADAAQVEEEIRKLPRESQRTRVREFLETHAVTTPKRRISGRLKVLKGERRDLFQYRIDPSYRLIYSVDEKTREIHVEYIGAHPEWGRRTQGRRRIR